MDTPLPYLPILINYQEDTMQGGRTENNRATKGSIEVHPKYFPQGNQIPTNGFPIDIADLNMLSLIV